MTMSGPEIKPCRALCSLQKKVVQSLKNVGGNGRKIVNSSFIPDRGRMGSICSSFVNPFKNVPFPFGGDTPTTTITHASTPIDTSNSVGTTAGGEETAISITGTVDPGGADNTGNNNSGGGIRSNWWSLTELLLPATICAGVYYSIPPLVQDPQHSGEFPLYEPLQAVVLLGISSSAVAIYHAFPRNPLTVIEAEKAELDEEKFRRTELVKERFLEVGLLYSLFAFLLRIMLELSLDSLGRLVLLYIVGGMLGAIYLYIRA